MNNTKKYKELLELSNSNYDSSIRELEYVNSFYENDQWEDKNIKNFLETNMPPETYNLVRYYTDVLIGYFSLTLNDIQVVPSKPQYNIQASLLQDIVAYTMNTNNMKIKLSKIKRDSILHGVSCCYITPEWTKEYDSYGRKVYKIVIDYVPLNEIFLDPYSVEMDYSDATFIHRVRYVSKMELKKLFPKKKKEIDQAMISSYTARDIYKPEDIYTYIDSMYKQLELTHTVYVDEKDRRWSVYWTGDTVLEKKEITGLSTKFPYLISKTTKCQTVGFYGSFHDILDTQKMINKMLAKMSLKAMGNKLYVESGAVDDIDKLQIQENSAAPIVELKDRGLSKILRDNGVVDIQSFLGLIENAKKRMQDLVHVNDSILGQTYASESGRKVALQQNAAAAALEPLKQKIEQMYVTIGRAICKYAQQYYTTEQVLPLTDDIVGTRFVEINKPEKRWTGEIDANGMAVFEPVFIEYYDPATNEQVFDEEGYPIYIPLTTEETDIQYTDYQVTMSGVSYNNESENIQRYGEVILNGEMGRLLAQSDPAGFTRIMALYTRNIPSRLSEPVYELLLKSSKMIEEQYAQQQALQQEQQIANIQATQESGTARGMTRGSAGGGGDQEKMNPKSQHMKIGQNGVN